MRRASILVLGLAVVSSTFWTAPIVEAQETGLASIHQWRKVGRKTCLVDHDHSGSGNGASKKAAEAAAISSWSSFTAWEYGPPWGSFRIAESKRMTCDGGGTAFNCTVLAVACRPF
jgi:hypothetical protein